MCILKTLFYSQTKMYAFKNIEITFFLILKNRIDLTSKLLYKQKIRWMNAKSRLVAKCCLIIETELLTGFSSNLSLVSLRDV